MNRLGFNRLTILQRAALGGSALLLTLVSGSGCSSISVVKDRISPVRTAAIVGFGVEQRVPNTATGVLKALASADDNNGPQGSMEGLTPAELPKPHPQAGHMYDDLHKKLTEEMKWKVPTRAEMTKSKPYASFYTETTEGVHSRPFLSGKNWSLRNPEGIVEGNLLWHWTAEHRRKLLSELKVDALVVSTVQVELIKGGGLKQIVGAGDFHPQATARLEVYSGDCESPIWKDVYALGEESKTGAEHALGFADIDEVDKLSTLSARSAFNQLIQRYRKEI